MLYHLQKAISEVSRKGKLCVMLTIRTRIAVAMVIRFRTICESLLITGRKVMNKSGKKRAATRAE